MMPNNLARMLRMSPEIDAYNDAYSSWTPNNPAEAALYYQAMHAMQGMPPGQRPATDYENDENLRRYMYGAGMNSGPGQLPDYGPEMLHPSVREELEAGKWKDTPTETRHAPISDMWMRKDPKEDRLWIYGQSGIGIDEQGMPGDIGYEHEEEDVRMAGWAPVLEYIDEMIGAAQETGEDIPPQVRLRLEKILGRK